MQGPSRKRNRWEHGDRHDGIPHYRHHSQQQQQQQQERESLDDQAIASLLTATAVANNNDPNPPKYSSSNLKHSKKVHHPIHPSSSSSSVTDKYSQQQKDDRVFHSKLPSSSHTSRPMKESSSAVAIVVEEKRIQPSFALSGALAKDEKTGNVYNGIVLKFVEPPEARAPNTRWRLYVFKKKKTTPSSSTLSTIELQPEEDAQLLDILHISKQSAYLFGREKKIADIHVEHPSLSKQHAVLQYRAVPDKNDPEMKVKCKPYLMDLQSTNGTFINGIQLEGARYYELRKGDVITLGASTREYVLLTENSTDL